MHALRLKARRFAGDWEPVTDQSKAGFYDYSLTIDETSTVCLARWPERSAMLSGARGTVHRKAVGLCGGFPTPPEPLSHPSADHAASVTMSPTGAFIWVPASQPLSVQPVTPQHPTLLLVLQSPGSTLPLPSSLFPRSYRTGSSSSFHLHCKHHHLQEALPHYPNTLAPTMHTGVPFSPLTFSKIHIIPWNDLIGLFIHLHVHYLSLYWKVSPST